MYYHFRFDDLNKRKATIVIVAYVTYYQCKTPIPTTQHCDNILRRAMNILILQ